MTSLDRKAAILQYRPENTFAIGAHAFFDSRARRITSSKYSVAENVMQ
jgi:hypothetical protein